MGNERITADLLLRHGLLLTMDIARHILVDGSIAIGEGRIVAIGPDREVAPNVEAAGVRDLAGALVHPGFIDAHVHTISDMTRALIPENIDPGRAWRDIKYPFYATVTSEEEYLSTLLSCLEMVASGTTTYADTGTSFELTATARAIDEVGMRAIPGYKVADVPMAVDRFFTSTEECINKLTQQLERYPYRSDQRIRCAVTLTGRGYASDRLLLEAKSLADQYGVPMIMHQSWDEGEVTQSLERYGKRPVEHLADLGILSPNLTLVHMIWVEEREIELVARSGACVVHCPAESARCAGGALRVGRFPEMLAAGIPVALGSDGPSGKHDIARAAYLVAMMFKEVRGQLPMITAESALEMATIHGAQALGIEDEVGSLEIGKKADLVIHRIDRPESHPRYDPVSNLIYASLSQTVDTVFVNGEAIFDHGEFTRVDAREAYRRVDAAGAALVQRIGAPILPAWPIVE